MDTTLDEIVRQVVADEVQRRMAELPTGLTQEAGDRLAYSPAEAARLLGISRGQLYEMFAQRKIAARKLGSRTLVRRVDIEAFLDALPTREPG